MMFLRRIVWAFRFVIRGAPMGAEKAQALAQLVERLEQLAARGPEYSTANSDLQRLAEEYKVERSEY